jgi:hypothetical protein
LDLALFRGSASLMLANATQSIVADKIPLLRRLAPGSTRFVGIDIGIDRVKIATFGSRYDQPRTFAGQSSLGWISQSEFLLPVDPQSPAQPDWVDLVADYLADRLPRCIEGDRNNAVIALPMPWIHYQTTPESEIAASQSQCDSMFSSSMFQSKAHLSKWPVVAGKGHYVIAATAESAACRVAESIASVGYQVQSILPHGVALVHAASALTSLTPSVVLLLESSGGLIASCDENGCGLCRTLPARRTQSEDQRFIDELEPWLQVIASEVEATSRYVDRLNGQVDRQSPVLICGRAAQIDGVDAALASMLGRPVATWRYAGRMRPRRQACEHDQQHSDSSMAVSLSLAFCGLNAPSASQRSKR